MVYNKILKVSHADKKQLEKAIDLLKGLGCDVSEIVKTHNSLENSLTELSANLQDDAIQTTNT